MKIMNEGADLRKNWVHLIGHGKVMPCRITSSPAEIVR